MVLILDFSVPIPYDDSMGVLWDHIIPILWGLYGFMNYV